MRRWSQAEREAQKVEKKERAFNRTRARFKKLTSGAAVSFDDRGYVCLSFSNGQIFKCRGPLPESIYGTAPEADK